jgi:hypothetical protein
MPARSSDLPSYRERQALQILLSGNLQPAKALYASSRRTLSKMVAKGWIEHSADHCKLSIELPNMVVRLFTRLCRSAPP